MGKLNHQISPRKIGLFSQIHLSPRLLHLIFWGVITLLSAHIEQLPPLPLPESLDLSSGGALHPHPPGFCFYKSLVTNILVVAFLPLLEYIQEWSVQCLSMCHSNPTQLWWVKIMECETSPDIYLPEVLVSAPLKLLDSPNPSSPGQSLTQPLILVLHKNS